MKTTDKVAINEANKLRESLTKKIGSGRTEALIKSLLQESIANKDCSFLVLASNMDCCRHIHTRFVELVSKYIEFSEKVYKNSNLKTDISLTVNRDHVSLNGNLILFRGSDFTKNPSYKYKKWDKVFYDNSIEDDSVVRLIMLLEQGE